MDAGNWIALVGLVIAALAFLGSAVYLVYRFGCTETRITAKLDTVGQDVREIKEGRAMNCALHTQRLDMHDRQIDALFRKWDANPLQPAPRHREP